MEARDGTETSLLSRAKMEQFRAKGIHTPDEFDGEQRSYAALRVSQRHALEQQFS